MIEFFDYVVADDQGALPEEVVVEIEDDYPPLVVYNKTKDVYYKALGYYDKTGDIDLFMFLFREVKREGEVW